MVMEEFTIKDSLKITPMQVGGDGKTVQLILTGYLDTYNSPDFQSHVNSLIESGIKKILFNCDGLDYISSTGIGAFTAFLKNLNQRKGDMVIFGLQNKVMEVFQLLGFTKFFKIATDLDTALQVLNRKHKAEGAATKRRVPAENERGASSRSQDKKGENKTPSRSGVNFPLIFNCPHCGKKLKAPESGKFRCSGCKGVVEVTKKGSVRSE
jgi:anti-anti-sigma factor